MLTKNNKFKNFASIFSVFVFIFYFSSIVNVINAQTTCMQPGCYNSQSHPCSWVSNTCLFQFNSEVYSCMNVPIGSTLTVSCVTDNAKEYRLKVMNHENYQLWIGDFGTTTYMNGANAEALDVSAKSYTTVTTATEDNYHAVIEFVDRESCGRFTCTFTTVV